MIVLADARLATAVGGALWAATQSAGQAHGSLRRVYVERPLHDEFIEQLRIAAGKLRVGDPLDPATQLGPLANQRRRERLGEAINAAVAAGAVRVCGEALTVPGLAGAFQSPTILSGSVEQLEPLREAVPGPLVAVSTVANSLEAARLVNAGPQGRSVSIWTSDRRRAARIARELRPSIVWGNDHLPGRSVGENAAEAVRATVRPKLISWDPPAPPAPWRYPYGETSEAALRALAVLKSGRDGDREQALRSGGRALTRVAVRALRGIGER
jgi:acyl-CoA reductase-like NAD-dependent aldehyde dehydrogenase